MLAETKRFHKKGVGVVSLGSFREEGLHLAAVAMEQVWDFSAHLSK